MKKVLSAALALLLAFSCFFVTASAAGDSPSAATSINLNSTYSSSITSSSTIDFFKFTLSSSGRINLTLSANIEYAYFYIYAANDLNNPVWKTGGTEWNSTTELIVLDENIDLVSGTYYLCVKQGLSYTGNYNFKLKFTSANESFKETQSDNNNSTSSADSIKLGTKYYGQIAANDEKDFYKFSLSSSGDVTIDVSASIQYSYYYLYDASAKQIWSSGGKEWNYSTELLSLSKKITLSAGTYYFCVKQGNTCTGNYNFKIASSSGSGSSGSVSLSVANSSVSVKEGSSTKVTCGYSGSYPNSIVLNYSINDKNIVSCEWGSWNNKQVPLTIKGLKEGSATITIKLLDGSNNAVLDTETIKVTVTAPSSGNDGGSDGGNDGGSDGGSSSGGVNWFTLILNIILFPIRLILKLFF
ncbi:MAG: hypothetical protein IJN38_06745 [Clostridia bacterium]|nr:hypothetical protein [Clostridia bacterium]